MNLNLNQNNNLVTSVLLAVIILVVSTAIITPSIREQQIQTARAITSTAATAGTTSSSASASASASASTSTTNPTKTFNLVFDGKIFPIKCQITGIGNKLNGITIKEEAVSKDKTQKIATALTVNIASPSNGKLIIALPTALIDSPITFSVFEDNKFTQQVKEITRFSNLVQQQQIHVLSIDFNKGTKQIEIDSVS